MITVYHFYTMTYIVVISDPLTKRIVWLFIKHFNNVLFINCGVHIIKRSNCVVGLGDVTLIYVWKKR